MGGQKLAPCAPKSLQSTLYIYILWQVMRDFSTVSCPCPELISDIVAAIALGGFPRDLLNYRDQLQLQLLILVVESMNHCSCRIGPLKIRERKTHININKCPGSSQVWLGCRISFVCFCGGVVPYGEEKTHKQNSPPPQTKKRDNPVKLLFTCFFLFVFFSPPIKIIWK